MTWFCSSLSYISRSPLYDERFYHLSSCPLLPMNIYKGILVESQNENRWREAIWSMPLDTPLKLNENNSSFLCHERNPRYPRGPLRRPLRNKPNLHPSCSQPALDQLWISECFYSPSSQYLPAPWCCTPQCSTPTDGPICYENKSTYYNTNIRHSSVSLWIPSAYSLKYTAALDLFCPSHTFRS